MSYRADKEARRAARRSLQTQPLKAGELSRQAVSEPHITPSLLFETLAPRPPSRGSVGHEHIDSGLEGRLASLEKQVSELNNELSYLRGILAGKDLL